MLALLYDDFISGLWQRGKTAASDFWQENKSSIMELLKAALYQIGPKVLALGAESGISSEDPYAVDT